MTIRFLALLSVCIAIALLSLPNSSRLVVANTGRDLDIAIVGRGYFCMVGDADCLYTRSGALRLDANGQLVVDTDGGQWPIDPPIQFPNHWERVAFLSDGRVQTLSAGSWIDAGQLQLAVFQRTPAFNDELAANPYSDAVGLPSNHTPGNGAGVIQQGWLEQRPSIQKALAISILLAILASCVLWRCVFSTRPTGVSLPHASHSDG